MVPNYKKQYIYNFFVKLFHFVSFEIETKIENKEKNQYNVNQLFCDIESIKIIKKKNW